MHFLSGITTAQILVVASMLEALSYARQLKFSIAFSALRTYALSGRNTALFVIVMGFSLGPQAVDLVSLFQYHEIERGN